MNGTKKETTGRGSLSRPNFASGQLLEDDDLNASVAYTRNVVRLLLRSVFGAGIVCGLKVEAKRVNDDKGVGLIVSPGVAFDCAGNVIEVEGQQTLTLERCDMSMHPLWVTLYYDECRSRPREVACDSACGKDAQTVSTRLHEGFRIEVIQAEKSPEGACRCGEVDDEGNDVPCFSSEPFSCGCKTDAASGVVLAHIEVPANAEPLKVNDKVKPRRLIRPTPYGAA
ncbi:hypothetical protein QTH90_21020 [Variovorax sp. J2P1-59]|uniref:hypothetical protein n=1 Tax=Variovorax flavidus TaxID=3053501 RepID=UPI0025782AE2|nr:hypothetical protein [Variovorax sp. J2P1-59]MDM0076904.1 hypothetical protein [Variovorax sp. J2P1-59]